MIYIKSIHLANFKGIEKLTCVFEDITLLVGLNNSGKTTLLQAVHLLTASLSKISVHQNPLHPTGSSRRIDLKEALASLGLHDISSLFPYMERGTDSKLTGVFSQGFTVELQPITSTVFEFTLSSSTNGQPAVELQQLLLQAANCSAEFVTPPGTVSSREDMMPRGTYGDMLAKGKESQVWRNAIWWSVQQDGYESFESVKALVTRYFPDVEVLQPTLGGGNPPEIILNYKERKNIKLDIALSGSGLRTFLTLARLLQLSSANILILDEPDAHLHASQQGVVLDLLMDTALEQSRQVIIASHSPEFVVRTPIECIRWIEQGNPEAQPDEMRILLERLGVTPDVHLTGHNLPEVIVYVEGKTDKPMVESLISWCRHRQPALPNITVVTHQDGRFDATALEGISNVFKEMHSRTRIVGIRDLDWYYHQLPKADPEFKSGDGWELLTLPCKELENLFCDPDLLFIALLERVPRSSISSVINDESRNDNLVNEWGYQVKHRIRDALSSHYDSSTRDRMADELFDNWRDNPEIRRRLVAGKELLRRVRLRLRDEFQVTIYPQRIFEHVSMLTPIWSAIATSIFPGTDFSARIEAASDIHTNDE